MAELTIQEGMAKGTTFRLSHETARIGRNRSCEVRVEGEGISRDHAELRPEGDAWVLHDLQSTNGVFVNGQRVTEHTLTPGDRVGIGSVTLSYQDEAGVETPSGEHADAESSASASTTAATAAATSRAPSSGASAASVSRSQPLDEGVTAEAIEKLGAARLRVRTELAKVIVGQGDVIDQVLTAIISRGHCLMVGVPGLAKTLMVSTIARVLDLGFTRVQFTPDLMPSDITGTDILDIDEATGQRQFRFVKGPIFTNMLLADEINRTPPKTQASLLEAMQEHSVTASGYTYNLDQPFFVLATQNPLEQEGTYPLPEAQLDRFMFNVLVDYPSEAEEEAIVARTTQPRRREPDRVLDGPQIVALQQIVRSVRVSDDVIRYAVSLVRATRPLSAEAIDVVKQGVQCGAGPRACQYLVLGAKARAVLDGRATPTRDDVRAVAIPVLRHRVFVNFNAASEGIDAAAIVKRLVKELKPADEATKHPIARKIPESAGATGVALPEWPKPGAEIDPDLIRRMKTAAVVIRAEIQKVIVGQTDVIDEILTCILASGHALLVGVPGLAKTLMVRTIASVLDLDFRRVQFTPDLMPSDITGADVLEEDEKTGKKHFRFIKGPIFTNMLLADEINRTPPKTQAALLEAMQEFSVTASGKTYQLRLPFFVLATQNPLEQEGTYPLPEAQLDRFMFNIHLDYPSADEEAVIIKETTRSSTVQAEKVLTASHILNLQAAVKKVPVSAHVIKYATRLVRATRPNSDVAPKFVKEWVYCGAGPRACQYLVLAAKARAVMDGRLNVSCNDVRAAVVPVLRHRVFTNFTADSEGITSVEIAKKLLEIIAEPNEKDYAAAKKVQRTRSQKPAAAGADGE